MSETMFIFDLDGTLYDLDGVPGTKFGDSRLCSDVIVSTKVVIADLLDADEESAEEVFDYIMCTYSGELSIGLEAEYGLDRYDYFARTWNKEPSKYIEPSGDIAGMLAPFAGRSALLSAAPRVWVDGVLNFLGLKDVFGSRVYTAEPDLRKPNPEIFKLIARELGTEPGRCVSIGDQNHSDIVPAKETGMLTALIGPEQLDADMFGPDLANIITQLKQKELL